MLESEANVLCPAASTSNVMNYELEIDSTI
jgi:hypothetical protein